MNTRKTISGKTASKNRKGQKKANTAAAKRSAAKKPSSPSRSPRRRRKISREEIRRQNLRKLLLGFGLGLSICLLIFSIWQLASIFMGYHAGSKEYKELKKEFVLEEPMTPDSPEAEELLSGASEEEGEKPFVRMERIDLASLQAINSEAVGWIEIPNTNLSYPIVHTSDNAYYLNHTFRKEENRAGAIFIETANNPELTDLHTIIYGHNMKDGSMFAALKDYKKEKFWKEHPYVYIDLANGSHCYQIFSCHEAPVTDITYTIGYAADDSYLAFLDSLKASSLYDTEVAVGTEDSVITLSTCTSNSDTRFVVHAKKIY